MPRRKKLTEEEKLLKKTEKQQKLARDHFEREANFTNVSKRREVGVVVEEFCKSTGKELLIESLQASVANAAHCLERSELMLDGIQTHREHSSEQHSRLFSLQSKLLSNLYEIYQFFLNSLSQMYHNERDTLLEQFFAENVAREGIFSERKTNYENYAHAYAALINSHKREAFEHSANRHVEIESWSVEKRDLMMEKELDRKLPQCELIWDVFEFVQRRMWPKSRLNEYHRTKVQDDEEQADIDKMMLEINEMDETVRKLQDELQHVSHKNLLKVSELKCEDQFMEKLFSLAEFKLKSNDVKDRERIRKLVTVAEICRKKLKSQLEVGKRIERAQIVCKKYEKLEEHSFNKTLNEHEKTSNFNNKVSQVEAECIMLKNRKQELIGKNENLRKSLKELKLKREVEGNLQFLQLNLKPSVGRISQISHQISQIQDEFNPRRKFRKSFHYDQI